jgi:two-component system sensor histidine kinase AtoS
VDTWFAVALVALLTGALALGAWLAIRLSRPLAELASAAGALDLDGPTLTLASYRNDEIGVLARRLTSASARLRANAARLRAAERRSTLGEMARQVNHDIKNGLIPIRNVLRHLTESERQGARELAAVFAERRGTLESSVSYLDSLARNYSRLTSTAQPGLIDMNDVVRSAAGAAALTPGVIVETRLADRLPLMTGDPIAMRRLVDNIIVNAIESMEGTGGRLTISTLRAESRLRIAISDSGRGMSDVELAHAFDDFFTTKRNGSGLGLSVVQRLIMDMGGSIHADSVPGKGTTVIVELPLAAERQPQPGWESGTDGSRSSAGNQIERRYQGRVDHRLQPAARPRRGNREG